MKRTYISIFICASCWSQKHDFQNHPAATNLSASLSDSQQCPPRPQVRRRLTVKVNKMRTAKPRIMMFPILQLVHRSPPRLLLQAHSQLTITWHQVLQKSVSLQVSQKPFQCKQDEAHTKRICARFVLAPKKTRLFIAKKLLVSTDSQQCPPRPQVRCQLPVKVNITRTQSSINHVPHLGSPAASSS